MNYLGYSWVDMGMNLDEAMDLIRKAVDLRPSDGYIVDSLGWAYYRLGKFDDAVRELERAVSLKPDDPVLNDHLGDAYWRGGRQLEATFQWAHARDMKPDKDVLAERPEEARRRPAAARRQDRRRAADRGARAAGASNRSRRSRRRASLTFRPSRPRHTDAAAAIVPAAYTVQPGQSLWSIAADKLGNGTRYLEILSLNPELRRDPGRIVPGQELKLPASN